MAIPPSRQMRFRGTRVRHRRSAAVCPHAAGNVRGGVAYLAAPMDVPLVLRRPGRCAGDAGGPVWLGSPDHPARGRMRAYARARANRSQGAIRAVACVEHVAELRLVVCGQ